MWIMMERSVIKIYQTQILMEGSFFGPTKSPQMMKKMDSLTSILNADGYHFLVVCVSKAFEHFTRNREVPETSSTPL